MPAQLLHANPELSDRIETIVTSTARYRRVMACIDRSHHSRKVISHGIAAAKALGAELILIDVVETGPHNGKPLDPVAWDLQCREARAQVEKLAVERADEFEGIQTKVLEGQAADQICNCAQVDHVDLTVLCSHGHSDPLDWDMGRTARRIIDRAPSSILLIPARVADARVVQYRRLLVLLDGSSRAESAIPIALRLAEAHGAELLLVHAVPEPELTEIGPLEPEDIKLRDRLVRRNQRVAQVYLERIRARVAGGGVSVRTLILVGGDARHLLARAIADEAADLAVVASHGHGSHMDVTAGSVTSYLIDHTPVPLLVVRNKSTAPIRSCVPRHSARVRLPDRAMS